VISQVNRGEVWWVSFDASIGGEIRKTRPAVIVSNNAANAALNRVVVVPLTSQTQRLYPGEAVVALEGKQAKAMADQIMTVSKLRLRSKMASLSRSDMRLLEHAVLQHLDIFRPINGKI
jgi:mRNA interferase MazF